MQRGAVTSALSRTVKILVRVGYRKAKGCTKAVYRILRLKPPAETTLETAEVYREV